MNAREVRQLAARENYVSPAENAPRELRSLIGVGIAGAKRDQSPAPGDRSSRNEPQRQGWWLTLSNGWSVHLESSDDIRDPRTCHCFTSPGNTWRLCWPVSPLTLSVTKLLLISQGDDASLAVLVQSLNVITILAFTLATCLPLVLPILVVLIATDWGPRLMPDVPPRRQRRILIAAFSGTLLFFVVFVSWALAAFLLGVSALIVGIGSLANWLERRRGRTGQSALVEPVTLLLVGLLSLAVTGPWLPSERITLTNGSVRVGYMVAVGGPYDGVVARRWSGLSQTPRHQGPTDLLNHHSVEPGPRRPRARHHGTMPLSQGVASETLGTEQPLTPSPNSGVASNS
jgi:hypothetical protein